MAFQHAAININLITTSTGIKSETIVESVNEVLLIPKENNLLNQRSFVLLKQPLAVTKKKDAIPAKLSNHPGNGSSNDDTTEIYRIKIFFCFFFLCFK